MSIKKVVVLLFLFLSLVYSNDKLSHVSLQLQWKYQFQFAGYIIAKEKGFYKDIGLDVDLKEWSHGINMVDEVSSGKSEYAVVRSTSLIDISKGKHLIYLASIYQSSPLIFLTDKSSNIKDIKDFKNKTAMTTGDLTTDTSLLSMLFSQGVTIKDIKVKKPSFNPKDLLEKKADIMAAYISNEPFILKQLGGTPVIFSPKDYGFDFYSDILVTSKQHLQNAPQEVKAFKEATLKGWEYAFANIDEAVDILYKKYNMQHKSKEALKYEAKELKKLAYYGTDKLGTIEITKLEKTFDVYKLLGLVNRDSIDFHKIVFEKNNSKEIRLTQEETIYLQNKKFISMCIDPSWMPFEMFDQEGNYVGMSADYFKIFEQKLNIKFKVFKAKTWTESYKAAVDRKCDILSLAMETSDRKKYFNFTTPYLQLPLVIATKTDKQFVNTLKDIKGEQVGIPRGYAFVNILKERYPNLKIIEVENIADGLAKVANGELYGYTGTIATIAYNLQKNYSTELKITGKLDEQWNLGIGVRNDDMVLYTILQKVIDSVTPEQNREILNKWIAIKYEKGIDYSLTWKVFILSVVILLIMLYFYLKQQKLKNELQKQKDEFETIFRNSKDGIALLDLDSNFLNFNNEYLEMTGFTREELLQKSCIELTIEEDLEKSKNVIDTVIKTGYVQNFEKICKVKDDRKVYVNMSLSLMPDNQRILISTKDITQLKQLESHKKLASMGEMIGNIAHQWRQPLSVISTLASGMSMQKELGILSDEEFFNACANIDETSQYLSRTIDDFTNYISGKKQLVKFNLKNDTDSFIKLVDSTIKTHNINVILELEEHINIQGYPNELIQCFINIFNNAKDAMVINNVKTEDRYIIISQYIKDDKVYIEFKDTAGGIPQGVIEKIFEPYFTTKHEYQGTGIGLHMSYNLIVNSMGGTLEAENVEFKCNTKHYKGALFRIVLPLEYS